MRIVNPATEEVITEVPEDTNQSLLQKFAALQEGQSRWSQVPLEERVGIIKKFSALLDTNLESLAMILTDEVGKPLQQSRNEINGARARIKWLADNASRYLSGEQMILDGMLEERIEYEPLGVVCNISAWNYPYLVGVNVFIPALLGGNAVMYKPSEYATLTGLEIKKLMQACGVPNDVFEVAIGGKRVGETLLNIGFDGYFFTGSYKTGQFIYERVARKMVVCQCELGGKDPLYVTDDVKDIKAVAVATADGAFYNNGQSCCAVERIYVHENVYDAYIDFFVEEVRSWKQGSPRTPGVYLGPVTRKEQLDVLSHHVQDALQKGGKIKLGGTPISGKGYFFEPTVIVGADHSMEVMREESFGPVIGIAKVSNDDEAVKLMNDTRYGLTASVYSADQHRAKNILRQINSGTGYWNCCDRVSAALPWSGRKHSGFGTTLSHAGLRAFVRPKAYHLRGQ